MIAFALRSAVTLFIPLAILVVQIREGPGSSDGGSVERRGRESDDGLPAR
jgi:hypothetical protein